MIFIRVFCYSFVFSALNSLWAYPKSGHALLSVLTGVSKFLFLRLRTNFLVSLCWFLSYAEIIVWAVRYGSLGASVR